MELEEMVEMVIVIGLKVQNLSRYITDRQAVSRNSPREIPRRLSADKTRTKSREE